MKRLIIDLDGTIAGPKAESYVDCTPDTEVIQKMRAYREAGFEIVIFTARNMRTYESSIGKINAHTLPVVLDWLNRYNVPYDEIIVGKPWCGTDGFYVDDRAIRPDEFKMLSRDEIDLLLGTGDAQL
jgi:capsule biosynthesis phosphatase